MKLLQCYNSQKPHMSLLEDRITVEVNQFFRSLDTIYSAGKGVRLDCKVPEYKVELFLPKFKAS